MRLAKPNMFLAMRTPQPYVSTLGKRPEKATPTINDPRRRRRLREQEPIIAEQIAYYRARAPEYDEWFNRRGRYDRGPAHRAEWFQEINIIKKALQPLIRGKRILELACGTGLWTHYLAEESKEVEAVDASPEAIAINRESHCKCRIQRRRHIRVEAKNPLSTWFFSLFGCRMCHPTGSSRFGGVSVWPWSPKGAFSSSIVYTSRRPQPETLRLQSAQVLCSGD
jgi:hypothetical protein